jgi:hypothetical protein
LDARGARISLLLASGATMMRRVCSWFLPPLLLTVALSANADATPNAALDRANVSCPRCREEKPKRTDKPAKPGAWLRCLTRRARCLLAAKRGHQATRELKERWRRELQQARFQSRHSADVRAALGQLLAHVYQARKNPSWAQRILMQTLARWPTACAARAQLAQLLIEQGDLDLAGEMLDEKPCPIITADKTRWALLRSRIASLQKDARAAASWLTKARRQLLIYREDHALLAAMAKKRGYLLQPPLSLRAEIGIGYTSNINAGLPTTAPLSTQTGCRRPEMDAAVGTLELQGSVIWPWWRVQPSLAFSFRGQLVDDFETTLARKASNGQLSLRPGLSFELFGLSAELSYLGELYLINSGDLYAAGPLVFFEGHRAEIELSLPANFVLLAGGGRRVYRQRGRNRWEVDGGFGYGRALGRRVHLLLAVAGRYNWAEGEIFESFGMTALGSLRVVLPASLQTKVGLSLGIDRYPNAALTSCDRSTRQMQRTNEIGGQDTQVRVLAELFSPSFGGFSVGAIYRYTYRSTRLEVSFPYQEHRLQLALRMRISWNPTLPHRVAPRGLPLWHGVAKTEGQTASDERIRDLLRQDEAARRGSSCLN